MFSGFHIREREDRRRSGLEWERGGEGESRFLRHSWGEERKVKKRGRLWEGDWEVRREGTEKRGE